MCVHLSLRLLLLPSICNASMQEYYRTGRVICPSSESVQELREACDYLMIPFTEKTIQTQNLCESNYPSSLEPGNCPALFPDSLMKGGAGRLHVCLVTKLI